MGNPYSEALSKLQRESPATLPVEDTIVNPYSAQLKEAEGKTIEGEGPETLSESLWHGLLSAPGSLAHFAKQIAWEFTKPDIAQMRREQGRGNEVAGLYGRPAPTDSDIHQAIVELSTHPEMTGEEKFNAIVPLMSTVPFVGSAFTLSYIGTSFAKQLFEAPDNNSRAYLTGNFAGQFIMGLAAHQVGARVGKNIILARAARARAVSDAAKVAQARAAFGVGENIDQVVKHGSIRRELGFLDPQDQIEQSSIRARMVAEEHGNVVRAMIRAHRELTPNGTTIIPGVRDWRAILEAEKISPGASLNKTVHAREDGLFDVAMYGDESPLKDTDLQQQFIKHGYFNGQEVSMAGKNFVIDDIPASYAVRLRSVNDPSRVFYTGINSLARPSYTEGKILPLESLEKVKLKETLDPVKAQAQEFLGDYEEAHYKTIENFTKKTEKLEEKPNRRIQVALGNINAETAWNDWTEFQKDLQDNKFRGFEPSARDGEFFLPPLNEVLGELGLKGFGDTLRKYINPEQAYDAFTRKLAESGESISVQTQRFVQGWLKVRDQLGLIASWDRQVARFAKQYGYSPEQIKGLSRYLEYKQAETNREMYLSQEDKAFLDKATKEVTGKYGRSMESTLAGLPEDGQLPLAIHAYTNGMHLGVNESGLYILRDVKTGSPLGRFQTESAVRDYINRTGQSDGIHLDGGGNGGGSNIPPSALGGNGSGPPADPPPPHQPIDWLGSKPNKVERTIGALTRVSSFIQNYRTLAIALDNMMEGLGKRTHFADNVANLIAAINKKNVRISPYMDGLDKIEKQFSGVIKTKAERDMVGRWLETASSSELYDEIGPEAANLGEGLASRNIDTRKVYQFRRALDGIAQTLKKTKMDPADYKLRMAAEKAQLAVSMNMDHDHMWAVNLFDGILKRDINDVPLHDVTRYANTLLAERSGLDLTQQGFAKANGMKAGHVAFGEAIRAFLDKVALAEGIPELRRIFRYLAHYRSDPTTDFYDAFLQQKGIKRDAPAEFVSEMVRSGEVNAYELDPIKVALRYASGLVNQREILPVWNRARAEFEKDLALVPEENRAHMHDVFYKNLLAEVRGFPDEGAKSTQGFVNDYFESMGWKKPPSVSRNITNVLLALYSNWAIGLRPMMGLRHFWAVQDMYVGRFGIERTGKMNSYLGDEHAVKLAKEKGALGEFNPYSVSEASDVAQSQLAEGLKKLPYYVNKAAEIGLRGSGLKAFYDWTKAAVFNETRDLANDLMLKAAFNEIPWEKVYKDLHIESYERPFVARFQDMVNGGKYVEAADELARETAEEIVATYSQLHRVGRWRNNIGRLFGQFGVFPLWSVNQTLRSISRGSTEYITGVIARRAAMQGMLYGLSQASGLNLHNWYFWHGFGWKGGPLLSEIGQLGNNMANLIYSPFSDDQDAASDAMSRLGKTVEPLFMQDWLDAVDQENDYTPIQRAGRAIGIPRPAEE